jgi:hypothetical protein
MFLTYMIMFKNIILVFCLFPDFRYCKLNNIQIPGISGNAKAIAGKFIEDQDGGQGVEPPVRTGEKLAPDVGGIRLGKVRLA